MWTFYTLSAADGGGNYAVQQGSSTAGWSFGNLDQAAPSNEVMTNSGRIGSRLGIVLLVVAALAHAPVLASSHYEPTLAGDVNVTVKYTGKGEVDTSHRLWVWLFDSPDIGPGAMPVAELSLSKNGDIAAFMAVAAPQVWIAVAYDEKGGFAGSAPPPMGSPIALYGVETGAPAPVTPGEKASVTVTFNDTVRMQ